MKKVFKLKEAVDVGDVPQFFNPGKKRKVEQGAPEIEPILPDLSPAAQRYLELIVSDSYKAVLNKIRHYTGRNPAEMNLPGVTTEVMQSLRQIIQFEAGHEQQLAQLALDIVLSLPEFHLAKLHKDAGFLKFEISLGVGKPSLKDASEQLQDAETQMRMDDQLDEPAGVTPVEELDQEIAQTFSDIEHRRKLARVLFQGNAINKFYVFNLLRDRLDAINPQLNNLYGIACSYIHLLYYATPEADLDPEQCDDCGSTQGSCQVISNPDGTYTVKSSGVILPFLIHELVKCIFEYFIVDLAPKKTLDKEQLSGEIIEFLSGPEAYKLFIKYIPHEQADLIPLIYQRFVRLPIADIKTVLSGSQAAKPIIDRLARESRRDLDEYKSAMADHEREGAREEFGNGEDE